MSFGTPKSTLLKIRSLLRPPLNIFIENITSKQLLFLFVQALNIKKTAIWSPNILSILTNQVSHVYNPDKLIDPKIFFQT